MSNPLLERGLAALAFSRKSFLGLLEGFPDSKLTYQPFPGANHALWIMGHLANADEFFTVELGGRPKAKFEAWKDKFFMGSKPTANIADYPPVEEVRAALSTGRESLVSWFKSMNETQLMTPLPQNWQDFGQNFAALMFSICWHEGLHTGQFSAIRKSLGMAPKFG